MREALLGQMVYKWSNRLFDARPDNMKCLSRQRSLSRKAINRNSVVKSPNSHAALMSVILAEAVLAMLVDGQAPLKGLRYDWAPPMQRSVQR
jgi:hypothetical protein